MKDVPMHKTTTVVMQFITTVVVKCQQLQSIAVAHEIN